MGRKKTVLLIDNDPDFIRALVTRLTETGFRCITAASGTQGLVEFENGHIDLIVSDLNMPGGDGVVLAETIRRYSNVPIIFVTGFRDDFKLHLQLMENVTMLQKPFDSHGLIRLITSTLGDRVGTELLAICNKEKS
jgi:two-component system OmpR family response regulator